MMPGAGYSTKPKSVSDLRQKQRQSFHEIRTLGAELYRQAG